MKDQTEPLFGDNGGTFATPQVRNVTDELEGASTGKWTWGVGDIAANPIRLAPTPVDVAKAQHLVSAENPAFASVTKVFSYLAAKVATLKQEVRVALPPPPCGYRALQDVAAGRVPAASCRGAALRLAASATGHAGCSDVCTTLSPLRAAIPLAQSAQPKKKLFYALPPLPLDNRPVDQPPVWVPPRSSGASARAVCSVTLAATPRRPLLTHRGAGPLPLAANSRRRRDCLRIA